MNNTPLPDSTDVLVVGAGPVGLTVAVALRLHGIDVTVIDRQAAGANTSRAAVVHPRTLEVLDEIGVTDRLSAHALHLDTFAIRDRDRVLMPLDFGTLPGRYRELFMVPQSSTEQVLLERFIELGGRVHRPMVLESFDAEDGAAITAVVRDAADASADAGPIRRVTASYLIGADGMHSTVRELAGIGFGPDSAGETFTLADVTVDGGLSTDEVGLFFSQAGLLVSAPLPDGTVRLVAEESDPPAVPDIAHVQRLLDERGPTSPIRVTGIVWGSRFRVHHRVADTFRRGRVLLAGDAAHVHSPAGGQGMNLGLRDAVALATAVRTAIQSPAAADAALTRYADDRRPQAEAVVTFAGRLTRLATTGPRVRPIRNLLLTALSKVPAVRRGLARRLAGLDDR